jgi:polyhydroxyalkanoate synthesis regulator phasin
MDAFKKATLFSMGAAAISWEWLKQVVDDLVERGDMTVDEGKKIFDEMASRVEEEGRTLNEKIKNQVRDALKDMGVSDRAQAEALESRINALESQVAELATEVMRLRSGSQG